MQWDIFCRVIDNFGDIGVCWRLAADLAGRGESVRLWTDDASALDWMAPGARQGRWAGVEVHAWAEAEVPTATLPPAEVWIEGFGCEIPEAFVAARFELPTQAPTWINLEYLSAEPFVERVHGLPSPIQTGPARGHLKHFFYPGFTPRTGGLLREPDLAARQRALEALDTAQWLRLRGVRWSGAPLVSLFCYEPAAMASLLAQWSTDGIRRHLLVTPGRATACVRAVLDGMAPNLGGTGQVQVGGMTLDFLAPLPQPEYDCLLWACELNFVRGEDSLVRAIWAGRPFVWQIYPQQDSAHASKLQALLDQLQASDRLRQAHLRWNGLLQDAPQDGSTEAFWSAAWQALPDWRQQTRTMRLGLLGQSDLGSQLLVFVKKNR